MDLTFFGGGEFTFGAVYDRDTPRESGLFLTSGAAAGGNVGAGVTLGHSFGDIEGQSSGMDLNTTGPGFAAGRGEDGEWYTAIPGGIGFGLSANHSKTNTWAPFKGE